MSTSDYTYTSLFNNKGNTPHNATINHPSTSTYHQNYFSTSYYPQYNQQLPHTNINNNFVINNNNIDERNTSDMYGLQCNQTQQYQQPQPFRVADTYNGGVGGGEGYKMSSTATNWFKTEPSLATEQQSNVMNIISMTSSSPLLSALLQRQPNCYHPQSSTAIGDSPTAIGDSPTTISDSPTAIGDSPTDIGDSPTNIGDSPTDIGDSPPLSTFGRFAMAHCHRR
ncbi:hypothetical protein Bhyg_08601 [Pseudolycoriella hygida]|uniref:Uncharacterized protein n=1 Tax=Pseudolycoriella hygida TaxID=35572 RepID=A0A9Q0N4X2_9DIPT|nr:hypothetical protein Bhyg_08601 [Pseudolycoriella hygida]